MAQTIALEGIISCSVFHFHEDGLIFRFHELRHTFGSSLVNGIRQPDGTLMALSPRQVADLLGHSTSQITQMYYVKKDTTRLQGITDGFDF